MVADAAAFEVWLESHASSGARTVAPWVRSVQAANAGWRLRLTRDHAGGRSEIRQSGALTLAPGVARQLSLNVIDYGRGERCVVEVEIFVDEAKPHRFRFDCPER